jgi:hypothetical protein
MLILTVMFANCSSGGSDSGNSGGNDGGPVVTDAWDAPVGDLVQGVTLFDGWSDLRVLPAPVNVDGGWTDSAAISNDGKTLYFTYTRYSIADLIDGVGFTSTGPARPGMTGEAMKNFKATLENGAWVVQSQLPAPFNSASGTWESSLSPNAAEDLIIWSRWDSSLTKASLYYSYKQSDGTWTAAAALPSPINNSNCNNDNGFVVGSVSTGVDIYWESDRTDINCSAGGAKKHIYHSYFNAGTGLFSAVESVAGVNGTDPNDEDQQFFVTSDKKQAYWTAVRSSFYGLYTADLVGTAYMNARPVAHGTTSSPFTGKLTFLGEINVTETTQGWLAYFMCGIASRESGVSHGVHLSVCRMKKERTAAITEAKKINTSGWSDSPFISRDGQRLYFMYSRWDFAPWIKSGGTVSPVLTGPDRPGLNKSTSNPWDESDIYVSTKNSDGTWGEPVNLGLNGAYGDASGMEFNSGNSFIWLRGNGTTNNLVTTTKTTSGTWGPIEDLGTDINLAGAIVDNPFITEDGNFLYFSSSRTGTVGSGGKDNWFSSKNSSGTWAVPVNLGVNFNAAGDEDQPFIPNGGSSSDFYWNSASGLIHCVSNGSTCTSTNIITFQGCDFAAEISMPDDGQTAYFGCGTLSTGRVKIMYSEKTASGTWGPAIPVD